MKVVLRVMGAIVGLLFLSIPVVEMCFREPLGAKDTLIVLFVALMFFWYTMFGEDVFDTLRRKFRKEWS